MATNKPIILDSTGQEIVTALEALDNSSAIGSVSALTTDDKSSLVAAVNEVNSQVTENTSWRNTQGRRTRKDITSLVTDGTLKQCITNGTFVPYDILEGDEFTVTTSSYRYVVADLNHFKGNAAQDSVISSNHLCLLVNPASTVRWNTSNTTVGGYYSSNYRTYLTDTVLTQAKTDLEALGFTILTKRCLETTAINSTGYNRFGSNSGCSNSWSWYDEQIIALSECNVYGGTVWSSSGYDTGEANRQLKCFKNFSFMDIFKMEYVWLKDVGSATSACLAGGHGGAAAGDNTASTAAYAVALICVA